MDELAADTLDELLADCLAELELRGPQALAAVCAEHPEHAEVLEARLTALMEAGLLAEPDRPPERLGDFRLGARLGGGGMGVVYAAVQESLDREVALKVVRGDQLYFPGARERFRREVRLVSRLAHGAIVPVYAVGEEGGVPYLTMERLRGATVAEALALLDGAPARGADLAAAVARVVAAREGGDPQVHGALYAGDGVHAALTIARRIAEALAHAHSRGVLHRDVKPSNVMLTCDGRALLFDFGLASSAQISRLTRSGSRVGSLAYMAPEQARGDELDERGDVHGLGALLWELLTGRPPRQGSPESISADLLRGEPVRLARARPDLPRDVQAVVDTALAPEPSRRYASAEALRRDLDNLLARRPIEARPAGLWLRGLRWVQRHPARAAALFLAVAAPAALAVQQHLAGRAVATQFVRAEANLERVLEALDVFVLELGTGPLRNSLMAEDELLALLGKARDTLEQLIDQRPEDVHLRCRWVQVQAARAHCLLGLGDLQAAEDLLVGSRQVGLREGVDDDELCLVHNALGLVRDRLGDLPGALESFDAALATAGDPRLLHTQATLSAVQRNRSRLLRLLGQPERGRAAADAAVAAGEAALALVERPSEALRARCLLAAALNQRCLSGQGEALLAPGELLHDPVGRAAFTRGLALLDEVLARSPGHRDATLEAVALAINAPLYLLPAQALEIVSARVGWAEQLVRDEPGLTDGLGLAMNLYATQANLHEQLGRHDQAGLARRRAAALGERVLAAAPDDLDLLLDVALVDVSLAGALIQDELRAQACEPAARAARHLERVRGAQGERPQVLHGLAWAAIHEGYGRLAQGDGERALQRAQAVPALVADTDPVVCVALGELHAGCAELADDEAAARTRREEALSRLERGVALGFVAADYLASAREWDGLRGEPRFQTALRRAGGTTD